MIWDPELYHKAQEAANARLFFDFAKLEAKAKHTLSPEQREAIEREAREFIRDIYEPLDPASALGAKELRRQCQRILKTFRRMPRQKSIEPLRIELEKARQKGLEFAHGEIYQTLRLIQEGHLSRGLLSELIKAADRFSDFQGRHTRKHYGPFQFAIEGLYKIYLKTGGIKRAGHKLNLRRRDDSFEYVYTDQYVGEAIDFIEEVFDQLSGGTFTREEHGLLFGKDKPLPTGGVGWYINESHVETFKRLFVNNVPPGTTFRAYIAGVIHKTPR